MKKVSIFLVMSLLSLQVAAQSSDEHFSFQRKQWNDVASLEDTWNVKKRFNYN